MICRTTRGSANAYGDSLKIEKMINEICCTTIAETEKRIE